MMEHPEEFASVEGGHGLFSFAYKPLPQFFWCGAH